MSSECTDLVAVLGGERTTNEGAAADAAASEAVEVASVRGLSRVGMVVQPALSVPGVPVEPRRAETSAPQRKSVTNTTQ